MKIATPVLLVSIVAVVLAMSSHGSAVPLEDGCTSCLGGSLVPIDQDFDSSSNASINLGVAVAHGGTCDPENGCAHQTPCLFAYSQIVNVGTEGGTIGYKYETSGAGGSQTVNATRSSVPPGGPVGGAVNSQIDVECGTSFIYTVSILTATTQTFLSASVNGTCSGCTVVNGG